MKSNIQDSLEKKWDNGTFLSLLLTNRSDERFSLKLPWPRGKAYADFYTEYQSQQEHLYQLSLPNIGYRPPFKVSYKIIQSAHLGRIEIMDQLIFENLESVAEYIGQTKTFRLYKKLVKRTAECLPELIPHLIDKPQLMTKQIDIWESLLTAVNYFFKNNCKGLYLSTILIPNLTRSFIPKHKQKIASLLQLILPKKIDEEVSIYPKTSLEFLTQTFGEEPILSIANANKVFATTTPVCGIPLSKIQMVAENIDLIILTEKIEDALIFNDVPNSLVICGKEKEFIQLKRCEALSGTRIIYWNDLSTQGFYKLASLRKYFPNLQSFLMNQGSLLKNYSKEKTEEQSPVRLNDLQMQLLSENERETYLSIFPIDTEKSQLVKTSWVEPECIDREFTRLGIEQEHSLQMGA